MTEARLTGHEQHTLAGLKFLCVVLYQLVVVVVHLLQVALGRGGQPVNRPLTR